MGSACAQLIRGEGGTRYLVVVAAKDYGDNVLANVMHVSTDSSQQHLTKLSVTKWRELTVPLYMASLMSPPLSMRS